MNHVILKLIYNDRNPNHTDDESKHYLLGQPWVNIISNTYYVCLSTQINNAVWEKLSQQISPSENYSLGFSNFLSNSKATIINTGLNKLISYVGITPLENTNELLGDVYVNIKNDTIEIYNTGLYNGRFCWFASAIDEPKCLLTLYCTNNGIVRDTNNNIECDGICEYYFNKYTNIELRTFDIENFKFNKWKSNIENLDPSGFNITQDTLIIANFEPIVCLLTIQKIGYGNIYTDDDQLICGNTCQIYCDINDNIKLIAQPHEGFILKEWVGVDIINGNQSIINMNVDKTIQVIFEQDDFEIDYPQLPIYRLFVSKNIDSGEITSSDGNIICGNNCEYNYNKNSIISLSAIPNNHYEFIRWQGDIQSDQENIQLLINNDINIEAVFEKKKYKLILEILGDGYISGDLNFTKTTETILDYNTSLQLFAIPNIGSEFNSFDGDYDSIITQPSTSTGIVINMDSDKHIICRFNIKEYRLELHRNGPGTIYNQSSQTYCNVDICNYDYYYGSQVFLQSIIETGQIFNHWDVNGSIITHHDIMVHMNKDILIIANFETEQFRLTVINNGNGTIVSDDNNIDCGLICEHDYNYNTNINLSAVANIGYVFDQWTGDINSTEPNISFMMDTNKTISANFIELMYTITLNMFGNGHVLSNIGNIDCPDVNCVESFPANQEVIFMTQHDGVQSIFSYWENYDSIDDNNNAHVIINEDRELNAIFISKPSGINYGYVCGGQSGPNVLDNINRFIFPLDSGICENGGNLTLRKRDLSSNNSTEFMYIYGGNQLDDEGLDTIEKYGFSFSIPSNSINISQLSINKSRISSNNSMHYGYVCGGMQNDNHTVLNHIEKFNFSNDSAISVNVTNIIDYLNTSSANNSSNYGFICGGWTSNGDIKDTVHKFFFFMDNANTSINCLLNTAKCETSANNSSSHGYVYGGILYFADSLYTHYDEIEKFNFSIDDSNSQIVNSLSDSKKATASNNSSIHGFICGGSNVWNFSTIVRLEFSLDNGSLTNVAELDDEKCRHTATDGTDFTNLFI